MKKKVRFSEYHRFRTFDFTLPPNELENEKREKLHTKPYSRECKVPEPTKKKKSPPKKKRSPQKKLQF